jgi:4,5-DOPA dioxygenase extradiol
MNIKHFKNSILESKPTPRLPALFVGHGSPTNATKKNEFTKSWEQIGTKLPRPKAILCISAHWFIDATLVHGTKEPQTIHDFYGFPPELYEQRYPAPGAPEIAKDVQQIVKSTKVGWDTDWGLDHGCWVPLLHLFPKADVPVFQMSIDFTKPPSFHYELGKELAELRRHGVMIVGSGNIVHNLGLITFDESAKPFDWAIEFDEKVKDLINKRNFTELTKYQNLGTAAHFSIPSPDHYWPMLYILGLIESDEDVKFFSEGIAYKSISMRSFITE